MAKKVPTSFMDGPICKKPDYCGNKKPKAEYSYANCCKYMPACKTKRIKICTLSTAKLFTAEVYAKICILCLLKNPYSLFFMLREKCLLSVGLLICTLISENQGLEK